MAFVRKDKKGNYYLYTSNNTTGKFNEKKHYKKSTFFVKYDAYGSGGVISGNKGIYFPKTFVGKRIRFRIEVVK